MTNYSLPPGETDPPRDDSPTFLTDALDLLRQLNLAPADPPPDGPPSVPGYEILGELGRGGMGVVYKARQIGLNRVVALKMILGKASGTSELLRFLAEAEAVAAVRHPNVVEVYELGQSGGRPYFAMEFVPNGSLSDLLRGTPSRRPAPVEAAALLAAVARGVHAAHQAGIVHRDLKPANILLSGGQRTEDKKPELPSPFCPLSSVLYPLVPKVSDFGLAKRLTSDLTQTLAVMGTPHYMAPEQAGGNAKYVGPATDVYALGVILYECLTGGVPFAAAEPWSIIRKVIDEAPVPPSHRADGVPRDLELICLKCLEKEPHHRYPTAAALAADLEAFAAGLPVSVRPVGAAVRAWRWAKRKPAQAALAAVLLLLALVLPPVVVWNRGQLAESAAAADGAKKAQAEAEKLAAARDLFGLTNAVRRRSADRPTGWTWLNRGDLARAADLAAADGAPLTDLRSEAVSAALAADLRFTDAVSKGMTASVAVTSPDGALVAVGEYKARGLDKVAGFDLGTTAKVRLIDARTGNVLRELGYPVGFAGGGPQDGTRSMAFSPDGRTLVVGTREGLVYRFDIADPDEPKPTKWSAFKTEVSQLVVSSDGASVYGRTLVEKPVHRWDATTGKLLNTFDTDAGTRAVAVEPGTADVLASDGTHFYRLSPDLTLRRKKQPVNEGPPRVLAFACGGRLLFAACSDTLVLFDPETLRPTARFHDPDLRRSSHQEEISSVAVHPTEAFVATSCTADADRQVKVWEVASGRRVAAVGVPGTSPISLAWSGDGAVLHATAAGQVRRFAFAPPVAERFACVLPTRLEAAALAHTAVAAVGLYEGRGDMRTLAVTDAKGTTAVQLPGISISGRSGVAIDPHPDRAGRVMVTTKDPRPLEWSPGKGVGALPETASPPSNPRFSPDGSRVWLTAGPTVTTRDGTAREPRGEWTSEYALILSGLPTLDALAVGPTHAVAGGRDGGVFVLKPEGEKLTKVRAFPCPGDPVLSVALSPDESLAAAGTQNGRVRLCRLADGTETTLDAHGGGVTGVSFHRDGELLATGGKDRTVKVWRRVGDTFEVLFAASHLPSAVAAVEFSRADDTLLVLLVNEHAVRLWDVARLRTHLGGLKLGW